MKKWLEGSVRRQIIAWNMVVLAVLFGVLGFVVRQTARGSILGSIDRDLLNRVRMPMQNGRGPGPGPGPEAPQEQPDGPPADQPDGVNTQPMQFNPTGRPGTMLRQRPGVNDPNRPTFFQLDGTSEDRPALDPIAVANARTQGQVWSTVPNEGDPRRVFTTVIPERPPHRWIIQVSYPLHDALSALHSIDTTLLLLSPVALILSVIGGIVLGKKMVQRVGLLSESAQHIAGGDFNARLPVQGDDEFSSLAQTINALLARQADAFHEKERLMEQQRRFVGDASHELKTPLTTIRGNVQLVRATPALSESVVQSLAEIDRASGDMNKLVQGLLELARADSGRLGHGKVEVLASEILDRASSRGSTSIPVKVQADPHLVLYGNEDELVRLFSNLIENARKYSPAGSSVEIVAQAVGNQVKVSIRDHGPGVAPEHLPHLGERFYRADSARTREDGGTGLGLAICKEIALAHGGRIEFQSQVGQGTVVTAWLPSA